MALINGVSVSKGDTGTYYSTDGSNSKAEVVEVVEADQAKLHVHSNTGEVPLPDAYCRIRITEGVDNHRVVTAPAVLAKGSRDDETHAFELDA